MKVAKLVLGILSILWSIVVVLLMSSLILVDRNPSINDLSDMVNTASTIPWVILLAAFFLAGGIVMLVCHKRTTLGGNIACAAIFLVGLVLSLIFRGRADIAAVAFILLLAFSIAGIVVAAIQSNKNKSQQEVQ